MFRIAATLLTVLSVMLAPDFTHGRRRSSSSSTAAPEDGVREARSVDEVSALKALVQQQASALQLLQTTVTALESRLTQETRVREQQTQLVQSIRADVASQILSLHEQVTSGNLSATSSQTAASDHVAFSARFKNDRGHSGADQVLKFDYVMLNEGSGYDPATGVFSVPVTGVYVIFLCHSQDGHSMSPLVVLDVMADDDVLIRVAADGRGDQVSNQIVASLKVGQRVRVHAPAHTTLGGEHYSIFTGYLLHSHSG